MADNYPFEGANKVYSDPNQEENGRPDIWVFHNGLVNFSRWKLTPAELEEINRTGEIVLAQLLGKAPMPQTFIGSEKHVRIATMDLLGRPMPKTTPKPTPVLRPECE